MPQKVRPTAVSLTKRGTPSAWPHELTLITDKTDPLYDKRVFNPLQDVMIRNMVLLKQIQPITVRFRTGSHAGGEMVVNAGRGRTKIITVINHLSGAQPYKGTLAPILEACRRLKGSDIETLCADRCPHGMKVQYVLYRGNEKDATGAMASENSMREDTSIEDKIRMAHTLSGQGFSAEEIVQNGLIKGKSVATIKRWLKRDPDMAPEAKTKGKPAAQRPSRAKILKVMSCDEAFSEKEGAIMDWMIGDSKDSDLLKYFPELKEALGL